MSSRTSLGWFARVALTVSIVTGAVAMASLRAPLADQGAGIHSITPPAAFVGDVVTITGAGFGGPNVRVFVGGVPAVILDVVQGGGKPSTITFRVPLLPAGPTQVIAMNPGGRASSVGFQILNHPPVADAGPDQTVGVGTTVQLDGRASTDVDGDALRFRWSIVSRPLGSGAVLSDAAAVRPTFIVDRRGTYIVQLIVNDGGSDSAPDTVRIDTSNSAPVANAGPDQTVPRGGTVQLDGTGSSDVDGDLLAFRWTFQSRPGGSQATLTDSAVDRPAFIADLPGRYVLELIVNDGLLDSKPATVRIDTRNSPPQANAGEDLVVTVGATVQLDGTGSSDADGDPLGFRWSFTTRPPGSAAALSNLNGPQPTFVADQVGTYIAQLIVNDPFEDGAPNTVVVVAQPVNQPPTVSAGSDKTITLPTNTVALNGSAADDGLPSGTLTVAWSKVSGPGTVTFSSPASTATNAQFSASGTYTLRLTASDGALSASADVTVTVNPAAIGNQPPVVNAGTNQSITLPASASLSGTASDDGLPGPPAALTTTWSMVSGPGAVTFGDASALATTASFSISGTYVLRLTANDGALTASADVTVTVNPAGTPGFTLELQSATASAFANATRLIVFSVVREGGFADPIIVTLAGAPAGVSSDSVQLSGGTIDSALLLETAASVAPGDLALEVVASGGGITRTAAFTLTIRAAEPRAQEKIQAALDAGTIDLATSLLYRAFALFRDPRLPVAYRGSGSVEEDRSLLAEIEAILPTVSPQLRAQLVPFTLRPAHDDSWYNQLVASLSGGTTAAAAVARPAVSVPDTFLPRSCLALESAGLLKEGWVSKRDALFPFRVWARCGTRSAEDIDITLNYVSAVFERLWVRMTASMGDPLPDSKPEDVSRQNGVGDETIDIYLVFDGETIKRYPEGAYGKLESNTLGVEWSSPSPASPPGSSKTSGFIILPYPRSVPQRNFHSTAIHEFFHLLQDAHNSTLGHMSPSWWYVEASARWSSAHFDRVIDWDLGEFGNAGRSARDAVYQPWFVGSPGGFGFQERASTVALNRAVPFSAPYLVQYEAFIWPYFMSQVTGRTAARPGGAVWKALEGVTDHDAADQVLDTVFSFRSNFRDFAVRNLNAPFEPGDALPDGDRYKELDKTFPDGIKPAALADGGSGIKELALNSTEIILLTIAPLAASYTELRVGDARIKKVVLDLEVLAAAAAEAKLDVDAMIKIATQGWKREDYNGKTKVTFCRDDANEELEKLVLVVSRHQVLPADSPPSVTFIKVSATAAPCEPTWVGRATKDFSGPTLSFRVAANVTWVLDAEITHPDGVAQIFKPEGVVTVDLVTFVGTPCTITPSTFPISRTDGSLVVEYVGERAFVSTIAGNTSWETTQTCGPVTFPSVMGAEWIPHNKNDILLSDGGKTITDTFTTFDSGFGSTSTFTFRLIRQ